MNPPPDFLVNETLELYAMYLLLVARAFEPGHAEAQQGTMGNEIPEACKQKCRALSVREIVEKSGENH